MSKIRIGEMIRELRGDKGISQEALADVCDVSMQAVSKWENGQSCPDITFLPLLAEYFGVSVDYLLTGRENKPETSDSNLTNQLENKTEQDILYIIQYRNGKILDKKQWNKERSENRGNAIRIQFEDEFQRHNTKLYVEVWGDANIVAPDTRMNLTTDGNADCGAVQGDINAGGNVNCDNVEGNVAAGGNVKCDTIEGNAAAGGNVSCDMIEGDVSAGRSVSCETIEGSAKAGKTIEHKNS